MRYLTTIAAPSLTIIKTSRYCVIDEIADRITLIESTVKLELTLPSILSGLKDGLYRLLGNIFLPGLQAYA